MIKDKIIIPLKATVLLTLVLANSFIWFGFFQEDRGNTLKIAFLNIGQGDAIFIQAPNGNTMLIDGGPDRSLLRELSKEIPFYKHSFGVMMVTNPDADHYAGFIDLLEFGYQVGEFLEPGTISKTPTWQRLTTLVDQHHIPKILARKGMKIMLDQKRNIYVSIIFPDKDVSTWKSNDGSIVAKLVYDKTSVMLQGDSTAKIEKYLVSEHEDVQAQILKAGHHGSKTSTTDVYVKAVSPTYAIISAGLNNKYGHPHKKTLDILKENNVEPLITFKLGTIEARSDGRAWKFSFI